jgi:hypothetical protein
VDEKFKVLSKYVKHRFLGKVIMGVKATYVVILALGLRPKQGLAKV